MDIAQHVVAGNIIDDHSDTFPQDAAYHGAAHLYGMPGPANAVPAAGRADLFRSVTQYDCSAIGRDHIKDHA